MDIEKVFSQMHPIDALQSLSEMISTLPGATTTFENTIPLSPTAKFICASKATVQPFAVFDGPIYLEENAFIGPYCFLRGPLYIGKNVLVGPYSELKNSIIMENSKVTHRNIIPDCVICKNVWLAGGVMVTNLRLDKKPVKFTWGNETKQAPCFGLYAEENSTLGVGTVVMPATYLTANTTIIGPTTIKGLVK